jgi:hypothetical protein
VRRTNQDYVVDNYYPQYIEDFKLRFQDIVLPPSLFDCELLKHSIRNNQTRTLSVCFDVKQKWTNQPLDLTGPRLYYIVMMDNKFLTSCPNCKSILLNEYYEKPLPESELSERMPQNLWMWLGKLANWNEKSIISNQEFSNAIDYLVKKKIIEQSPNEIKEIFLGPIIKVPSL